jgi:hypothetical protein
LEGDGDGAGRFAPAGREELANKIKSKHKEERKNIGCVQPQRAEEKGRGKSWMERWDKGVGTEP